MNYFPGQTVWWKRSAAVIPITQPAVVTVAGFAPLMKTPNIITPSDLKAYVGLLSPLIDSLDNDQDRTLVYADPVAMETKAAELGGSPVVAFMKKKLLDEAAILRERMKGKSAKKIEKEIAWSDNWRGFMERWKKDEIELGNVLILTSGGDWDRLTRDDLEYQQFEVDYRDLGYKTTRKKPPAPDQGFPWPSPTTIVYVVGGLVAIGGLLYIAAMTRPFLPRIV